MTFLEVEARHHQSALAPDDHHQVERFAVAMARELGWDIPDTNS